MASTMSNDSTGKAGTELVTRGEHGRLAPGTASLNPKGRPRRGETLAEQWRRATNWEAIRARLEAIALDPKAKHADSITAANALTDRCHGRPTSSHELTVNAAHEEPAYDLSGLSLDERRKLLETLRAAKALAEGDGES